MIVDIEPTNPTELRHVVPRGQEEKLFFAAMNAEIAEWTRDIQIHLCEGASVEVHVILLSSGSQRLSLNLEVVHGAHTQSAITIHGAALHTSTQSIHGKIVIPPEGSGSDASLKERVVILDPGAHVDAVPDMEIANQNVKATHAASVGRISDEQLFYLRGRGLSLNDARRMIVEGFLLDQLHRFPEEVQPTLIKQLQQPYEHGQ